MANRRLIKTPFGATSTAFEVVAGIDLQGRTAIVTGASSGIGIETARALAHAGANVTITMRNIEAGRLIAKDIIETTGNQSVHAEKLDLVDQSSVKSFVSSWTGPLHILVNNAGVMATPESRTPEGWELQFATNHFGHFALAHGLHRALASADGARIVSVSSAGHLRSPVVFEDIHFLHRPYDALLAYGQSKTANILFAVEAGKRWAEDGITVNAVMPGAIRTAGVQNLKLSTERIAKLESSRAPGNEIVWKSPQQGAATSVLVATHAAINGVSGRYFEDCNEADRAVPGIMGGIAPYALDPVAATRLWELSLRELKL
ncbi:SDR family NAD(P)-dependent oxidoreductase [Alicyclobacillus curvatus]|nr:SDR family NAD(P)-dependent oxidoreductase [Alicyclobacillus curvatus]